MKNFTVRLAVVLSCIWILLNGLTACDSPKQTTVKPQVCTANATPLQNPGTDKSAAISIEKQKSFSGILKSGEIYSYCWVFTANVLLPDNITVFPVYRYGGPNDQKFLPLAYSVEKQSDGSHKITINFKAGTPQPGEQTTQYQVALGIGKQGDIYGRFYLNPLLTSYLVSSSGTTLPSDAIPNLQTWVNPTQKDLLYQPLGPENIADGSTVKTSGEIEKHWTVKDVIPLQAGNIYTVNTVWTHEGDALTITNQSTPYMKSGELGKISINFVPQPGTHMQIFAICDVHQTCFRDVLTILFTVK